MKHTLHLFLFLLLVGGLSLSSCVTKGKFLASEDRVSILRGDSSSTHRSLKECNAKVIDLESQRDALQNSNATSQNDLKDLASKTKMTIADQAKRLKNLQDLIQSQKDVMNKLKKNIGDALINFKADELSIQYYHDFL